MRRHELELIAALAEGSLEDETEARALVESSPAHRAEYETQKAAIEAMRSLPKAEMTDHEKAALHRDLWTALQSPSPAVAKAPWYYRWSFAAAGVLVVAVGIGALVSQMGEDDTGVGALDAAAVEEAAADGEGATLTTQSESSSGEAAVDESTEAASPLAGQSSQRLSRFSEIAELTRSGTFVVEAPVTEDSDETTFSEEHESCVLQAGLDDYEAIGEVSVEQVREFDLDPPGPYLIAVPSGVELASDTPVVFIEAETCALVHRDG